jgi:hypothetical protein
MYYNWRVSDSLPEWTDERREHLKRSLRYANARDIDVTWANEAFSDPDAITYDPDPRSTTGYSRRTVGFSPSAGQLLTVVAYDDPTTGRLMGGTAYTTTSRTEIADYNDQ